MTYAAPLRVKVRLVVLDKEASGAKKPIKDVREQEVYLGELPLMTDNGTFIINGTERVIVSQLHRSPGVFSTMTAARPTRRANCCSPPASFRIAVRGWTSSSTRRTAYSRIDRPRKLPVTIILRALGLTEEQVLDLFFEKNVFQLSKKEIEFEVIPQRLRGETAAFEIRVGKKVIVEEGRRITARHVSELRKRRSSACPAHRIPAGQGAGARHRQYRNRRDPGEGQ